MRKVLFLVLVVFGNSLLCSQELPQRKNVVEDIQKGRSFFLLLQQQETDSLFPMMSDSLKSAVGQEEGLAKLAQQLNVQAGKEVALQEEASFREVGYVTYYRISEYEKIPSVTSKWVWKDSLIVGATVSPTPQPAPTELENYNTKTNLDLPFKGTWYVAWGGNEPHLNKHIQAEDQRYAFDFLYAPDGKVLKSGSMNGNEDFYGFGREIYAPGNGVVIKVVDTVHDNTPMQVNEEVPPGNHVIIDHGNGEYSLMAHFKENSIELKEGQKIQKGDFVGLVGNSGRSTAPHLHYHLQTGRDYREGQGLPIQFSEYLQEGQIKRETSPVRGEFVTVPVKSGN